MTHAKPQSREEKRQPLAILCDLAALREIFAICSNVHSVTQLSL
jgi:hypothetical protein